MQNIIFEVLLHPKTVCNVLVQDPWIWIIQVHVWFAIGIDDILRARIPVFDSLDISNPMMKVQVISLIQ